MLDNALGQWGDQDYRIFVGVYPNDRATLDILAPLAAGNDRLILCINERDGPTTKADCLNVAWRAMLREEERTGEIGRASCRERECQYVYIPVVAVSYKKKKPQLVRSSMNT